MIVLHVALDNIYGFSDFRISFTYPKKIVNSVIDEEHLQNRPSFRYKKAVILMGVNATGKTSLGRALLKICKFLNSGNTMWLMDMVTPDAQGSFTIDFVNEGYVLHRLCATIDRAADMAVLTHAQATIAASDTYEKCAAKLEGKEKVLHADSKTFRQTFGELKFRFAYPEIESSLNIAGMDKAVLLKTLKAVIGTLDPTLTDISLSSDLKDSFIIRRKGTEIIIQDGKLLNRDVLSSGTAEGVDIAIFLAAILSGTGSFYYCDEHFSYVQTEIEKRIFGIMLDHLRPNDQLIFTTHNTDMLDLNLPKHTFAFLRKEVDGDSCAVTALYASDILKRNTDSIRCAVENDVFCTLPDDTLLDTLEEGWEHA